MKYISHRATKCVRVGSAIKGYIMYPISNVAGLTVAILLLSVANAEPPKDKAEPVIIPLDQIWAYKMPGTRDIEEFPRRPDMLLMELVFDLRWERAERLRFKGMAKPGFAVSGSGRSALHAALAVFLDGGMRCAEFSPEDEIAIVFFSEFISRYRVQIREVKRKENEIEIRYELELSVAESGEGRSFVNFALIPLGKLPVAKYHVQIRQLPRDLTPTEIELGLKPLDEKWSRNFLCKPFSFAVTEKAD